jgi:dienelactone hydrolase
MDVTTSHHQLITDEGLPLRLDLRMPTGRTPTAVVVVVHGFKGFKDWGFFPHAGERLAAAGYASIVFDLSRNGVGEVPGEFDRLDLFEGNTYAREVADLEQVVAWVREEAPLPEPVRRAGMGLLGHSRGALPCVVAAAEDPTVTALVTWNGVGRALRYSERQLAEWEEKGRLEFKNARTGQRMAVGWRLVEDAREHAARYDLPRQARRMEAAHLILHADKDLAVDPTEAEILRAGREERCRVVLLEDTGHTFGAVHPFAGGTAALDRALDLTVGWYGEYLSAAV